MFAYDIFLNYLLNALVHRRKNQDIVSKDPLWMCDFVVLIISLPKKNFTGLLVTLLYTIH